MDYVYRLGRQIGELRAGGYNDEANQVHSAASVFIQNFEAFYGEEGRKSLSAVFRMAQMEDTRRSLWMGAWAWPSKW